MQLSSSGGFDGWQQTSPTRPALCSDYRMGHGRARKGGNKRGFGATPSIPPTSGSSRIQGSRRRVAGDKESTLSLAVRAAREALLVASLQPSRLDLVIVATVTPEYFFPSTASLVQDALGAAFAGAYDLSAGCSGFIYALNQAANAVRSGSAENVLVIGSETLDAHRRLDRPQHLRAVRGWRRGRRGERVRRTLWDHGIGAGQRWLRRRVADCAGRRQPQSPQPRDGRPGRPVLQNERPRGLPVRRHDHAQGDRSRGAEGGLATGRPDALSSPTKPT